MPLQQLQNPRRENSSHHAWRNASKPLSRTDGKFWAEKPTHVGARLELIRYATDMRACAAAWAKIKYRTGNNQEATTWLDGDHELELPIGAAHLAMSHHQLGDLAKARAAFDRLIELMKKPEFVNDADYQALFEEAQELNEGTPAARPTP